VPTCPRCCVPLVKRKTPNGIVYGCPKCKGKAVALPVVRRLGATPEFLAHVWREGRFGKAPRILACAHCGRKMARVEVDGPGEKPVALDLCTRCRSMWFDPRELASVPRRPPPEEEKPLPTDVRERLAVLQMKERQAAERMSGVDTTWRADRPWQWLPGILGLPVETDAPACTRRPYVTWTVAGLLVAVFLATVGNLEDVVKAWGFVAADPNRHAGATLFTSMLLHAGVLHLVANTYFFLVFGDNVEDHLGRWFMLVLLVGAHLAGVLLHAALAPDPAIPVVGASAGIFGIMGYYAVTFPWARIGILFRLGFIFRWIYMPAFVFLLFYLVIQVLGSLRGGTSVSYLGHLGGLATGIAVALVVRFLGNRRADEAMTR